MITVSTTSENKLVLDFSNHSDKLYSGRLKAMSLKMTYPEIKTSTEIHIIGGIGQLFTSSYWYELLYQENPNVNVITEGISEMGLGELYRAQRRANSPETKKVIYVILRSIHNEKFHIDEIDVIAIKPSKQVAEKYIEYLNSTKNKEKYYNIYIEEMNFYDTMEDKLDW